MVEVALPFGFAVEADALYRRTGYDVTAGSISGIVNFRVRGNDWEFPILAKKYWGPRMFPVRLYVSGGYVLRYVSGIDIGIHGSGTDFGSGLPYDYTVHESASSYYVRDNPVHGVAVGGGVRWKTGRLSIAPEARYTRWGSVTFDQNGSYGFTLQSRQNQMDVLVGFTF